MLLAKLIHQISIRNLLLIIFTFIFLGCGGDSQDTQSKEKTFANPQLVGIIGYPTNSFKNVQEPFISRDGQYLFFNTAGIENEKDLLFAKWDVNQSSFVFQGEIQDVNTPNDLEGNPTMDAYSNFFYINNRVAPAWISSGVFDPDTMSIINNISISGPPSIEVSGSTATVNMGVEVSSDGNTLYFSRAVFLNAGESNQTISASNILFAQKINGAFVYDETTADRIMQNINTNENLEYAACISKDELEFYFTRTLVSSIANPTPDSQIMRAVRTDTTETFSLPKPVGGIPNHIKFVEAPTIYGDVLYYHQFDNGVANLYKVTRE